MSDTPLERRRRRVHMIRTRIAAGAAALFIAVFGGITIQLISGHDPALATTSTTSTAPSATTSGSSSSAATNSSSAGQSSTPLSPVTTSQS